MAIHMLGGILCLLLLVGGCATPPLPGAAGEVSGPLRTIELYAKQPDQHERYGTAARDHLFASDREVHVHLRWVLPKSGSYVTKIVLRTPTGTVHGEREHRFEAKETFVFTWYRFTLPQGAEAQRLTGLWKVEVALAGAPVGQRTFTFDPGSIRLRTDARIVILEGTDDPELATGDWQWTNRAGALADVKAAHATLGIVLRDELARRFPHVDGPRQPSADTGATILVRTKFSISPNPDTDARLAVDVVRVPARTTRTFLFRSSAGVELMGASRKRNLALAATDLAFHAANSPEVLETLVTATQAVPDCSRRGVLTPSRLAALTIVVHRERRGSPRRSWCLWSQRVRLTLRSCLSSPPPLSPANPGSHRPRRQEQDAALAKRDRQEAVRHIG